MTVAPPAGLLAPSLVGTLAPSSEVVSRDPSAGAVGSGHREGECVLPQSRAQGSCRPCHPMPTSEPTLLLGPASRSCHRVDHCPKIYGHSCILKSSSKAPATDPCSHGDPAGEWACYCLRSGPCASREGGRLPPREAWPPGSACSVPSLLGSSGPPATVALLPRCLLPGSGPSSSSPGLLTDPHTLNGLPALSHPFRPTFITSQSYSRRKTWLCVIHCKSGNSSV